jgi:membrane-associated phospholipid phosphatase
LGAAVVTSLALVNDLPRVLLALSLSFFTLSVFVTVVNAYWKISVHTSMITFAVVTLTLIYSSLFASLAILVGLVLWARLKLGAHTLSQASAGAAITLLITYFWFYYFGLATFLTNFWPNKIIVQGE